MAKLNDTNNTLGKLENQWENLYEAEIDERDRMAIEEFVRYERQGNQNVAPTTLINDLSMLRNAALRADTPLVDMQMSDVRAFLSLLSRPKDQGGYGLEPDSAGVFSYKRALRVLFKWLDEEPEYGDYGFAERIKLPPQRATRVSEEDIFTEDEVSALKQAASSPRDKALIEFLADTGARISLVSQLRVGDIHNVETDCPEFTPNESGLNQKGAQIRRYPIVHSRADLRVYLNYHHIDRRDEAPLWHVNRGYDHDRPEEGALSSDRIRAILEECAARAGIDKRVNPHNFRHTAVTRLKREKFDNDDVRQFTDWENADMFDRYDHMTDTERNKRIYIKAGYMDEDDLKSGSIAPRACTNCRQKLRASERFCPSCGSATTREAIEKSNRLDDRLFESATAASGDLALALVELRRVLNQSPELREVLLGE